MQCDKLKSEIIEGLLKDPFFVAKKDAVIKMFKSGINPVLIESNRSYNNRGAEDDFLFYTSCRELNSFELFFSFMGYKIKRGHLGSKYGLLISIL